MENLDDDFETRQRLYEQTVQMGNKIIDFMRKEYKSKFDQYPTTFREDFCSSGIYCEKWVKSSYNTYAIGIDIDQKALDYGVKYNIYDNKRMKLINHNVLDPYLPSSIEVNKNEKQEEKEKESNHHNENEDDNEDEDEYKEVDINKLSTFNIICSMNYSHFLLTKRKDLLKYFQNVYESLDKTSMFFIDFYGGPHIYSSSEHSSNKQDNYYCLSSKMNIMNNNQTIDLKFKQNKKYNSLFHYTFRVYSLIELKEAMEEVGFKKFKVFIKLFNEDEEDDYEEYKEVSFKKEFYCSEGKGRFNGYLIGIKDENTKKRKCMKGNKKH